MGTEMHSTTFCSQGLWAPACHGELSFNFELHLPKPIVPDKGPNGERARLVHPDGLKESWVMTKKVKWHHCGQLVIISNQLSSPPLN